MSERSEIVSKLIAARVAGDLVACKIPGAADLSISFERHMLDGSMTAWQELEPGDRQYRIGSVNKAIKRGVKRMTKGYLTDPQMNELASDLALWLAYQLLYEPEGERWLMEPAPAATLRQALN